jgi:hypothetical protein
VITQITNTLEGARHRAQFTSMTPPAAVSAPNVFDIEDEVDWDNDELEASAPVQSQHVNDNRRQKPQQAAYKDAMRSKGQGKKRAFSPSRGEKPWSDRSWQNKAQKTKHPKPSSLWGPDPAQRQDYMQLPLGPLFGQPLQHDHGASPFPNLEPYLGTDRALSQGRQPRVSECALLESDPVLLHQGPPVPETIYDLRAYDAQITALHRFLPQNQRYISGNGKVAPRNYGSVEGLDLGLCYATFYTNCPCEMGIKCAWRHHPLTKVEREWILSSGGERGRTFLENLSKRWAVPDVPVPGATMYDK